ncbi:retinal-binding protein-like isoform X2 [Liolophura sinensis]|uniref:retinal-binding protein-like isoform X2 n=1 Tax=Liolophura sinensis TaxID=3198878 RepID=UPI0031591196
MEQMPSQISFLSDSDRIDQNNMACKVQNGEVQRSPKEEAAIKQFREKVKDLLTADHDDHVSWKWLKARDFNVNKAEQMFRNSMAYRENMKVDTLVQNYKPPEVLTKYLTGGFCGHDKDGSPVRIEPYGHLDMKGIMYSAKKSDLEKTKLLQCELTLLDWEEQSRKRGKRVDGLTVIFDMEGVSSKMLWRPGLQMYLYLVKVLEDNYPEMMKRMFVINAPRIFPILYKICRPLISEDMKNKIHVLGGDYKSHLLKYIDADQLPAIYGGDLKDPDGNPRLASKVCQGGEVPESYFLKDQDLFSNMECVTVPRGEKFCSEHMVEKAGSLLRWEFKTEEYDISFGVFYEEDGEQKPVVPTIRVNSHIIPEDGTYTCEKVGKYVLCFDNSFSWTRSKTIHFMAEVISAEIDNVKPEIDTLIDGGNWNSLAEKLEATKM